MLRTMRKTAITVAIAMILKSDWWWWWRQQWHWLWW